MENETPKPKQKKGFAVMSKEQVQKISSMGGVQAHKLGVAHKYTTEEAREAGKKSHQNRSKTPTASKGN